MKNKVKAERLKQGVNQTELARSCNVTRQTIHAVESGNFNPSVLLALKISKVLKLSIEKLFTLERGD